MLTACSKLENLNKNDKGITEVPAGGLFNNAVRNFFEQMGKFNVNYNNTELFVQHFAETTYPDESKYDMTTRAIPANHMIYMYRLVLNNLKEAKRVLSTSELGQETQAQRNNQLAITEIMSVYAWSNVVETYGDMPYSQALDTKFPTPVYDDAATIYADLIARLDAALASMAPKAGGFDASYDNIYKGDAAKWMRFANSLKLRMGLVLADVNPASSKTIVNSAIAGVAGQGVFVSDDKFALEYFTGDAANENPIYTDVVASGRDDYVVTSTLVDPLNALNDPRRDGFLWTKVDGAYVGAKQGVANAWTAYTHIDKDRLLQSQEVVLFDYAEVEFLLAEAAAREIYTGAGSAETHYKNAIKASILYWNGTADDATAYIAQPGVDYSSLIAGQSWKQVIGTQAYYAYYMRGMSAWLSWRRLDYPRLKASPESVLTGGKMPLRYIYPLTEATLNPTSYKAAVALMSGGDDATVSLFWDINHYNTVTGADN